jgi:hypothetical protein
MFARMFHRPTVHRTTRSRKQRFTVEALEGRQLLSLGAQFPEPINTTNHQGAEFSANASSANGSSVVVWTDQVSLVISSGSHKRCLARWPYSLYGRD